MKLSEADLPAIDDDIHQSDFIVGIPISIVEIEEGLRKDSPGTWQIWTVRDRDETDMYRVWGAGKVPCMKVRKFFELFPGQQLDIVLIREEFGDKGKFRYVLKDWPEVGAEETDMDNGNIPF